MTTIYNNANLKVELNKGTYASGTLRAYVGERTFLRVTAINQDADAVISVNWGYYYDNEHNANFNCVEIDQDTYQVDIDITDIVRSIDPLVQGRQSIQMNIHDKNNDETADFEPTIMQFTLGIDPNDIYVPYKDVSGIIPPIRILSNYDNLGDLIAPVFTFYQPRSVYVRADGGAYSQITGNKVTLDFYEHSVYEFATRVGSTYRIFDKRTASPVICGNRTVLVTWLDRFGIENRAYLYASKFIESVSKTTEFVTIDNSYDQHKSHEAGCTLWLNGLTPYDYWVYSAIVTSDLVTVDGVPVEVSEKKVNIPDGNDFSKIEIDVIYKRYDEI